MKKDEDKSRSWCSDNDKTIDQDTSSDLVEESNDKSHRLSGLEKRMEAIANENISEETGVTRLFPAEWDHISYPPKFEVPLLQTFNSQRSMYQHLCHFKAQTSNVMSNNAVLAHLFIGTLKRITFE